mmetsp:Transcript_8939/g.22503  ORF Transcript_8939/g.22503 Transcript_8939/m.22503 type:complete len:751 (-) Transcript_8939:234-2486(-)
MHAMASTRLDRQYGSEADWTCSSEMSARSPQSSIPSPNVDAAQTSPKEASTRWPMVRTLTSSTRYPSTPPSSSTRATPRCVARQMKRNLFRHRTCMCGSAAATTPDVIRSVYSSKPKYPMYVISVRDFLSLSEFLPHQKLKEDGLLHRWSEDMRGRVIFVSHEWLGNNHPDPSGEQCAALRSLLERLMNGSIRHVESHWKEQVILSNNMVVDAETWKDALPHMYIWLDFMSVPQPSAVRRCGQKVQDRSDSDHRLGEASGLQRDSSPTAELVVRLTHSLQKAVSSIHAYVRCSDLFLVLVPVSRHADRELTCNYSTWRSRGWCRLELQAATLRAGETPVMVCPGAKSTPYFAYPWDVWQLSAGEGEYTCCRLGHQLVTSDGEVQHIPCDRVQIGAVLRELLDIELKHLRVTGQMERMRWLTCMRHLVLTGLPSSVDDATVSRSAVTAVSPLQRLQQSLCWTDDDDSVARKSGRSLLMYAVVSDNLEATRSLTQKGCAPLLDLEMQEADFSFGELLLTPLMAAMAFSRFEVVEALLDAGACPHKCSTEAATRGRDVVMFAAFFARVDNIRKWMARFPDWDINRRDTIGGCTALSAAVVLGPGGSRTLATVSALLELRADPECWVYQGSNSLVGMACNYNACPGAIRMLIKAGANVNHQVESRTLKWRALLKTARTATHLGTSSAILREMGQWAGNTPLMTAARWGKVEEMRILLEMRADASLRNRQGKTALDFAKDVCGGGLLLDIQEMLQ